MNVILQCCGLAMLVIIYILMISERTLNLSSRRLYFFALLACMICLTLDIVSVVAIVEANDGDWNPKVTAVLCKAYVVSLLIQSYCGFAYASGEFFTGSHKKFKLMYRIIFAVGIVLISALPISYKCEGDIVYSYGPSTIATYVFTIVFIASTIAVAFLNRDRASRRRRRAILIWQCTWLLAALIQLLNPQFLLVGFAAALGMMILYAELENPREGIDRVTGRYTVNTLMDYIRDLYVRRKNFASVFIYLDPVGAGGDLESENMVMLKMGEYLNTFKDAYVFRNVGREMVMIFHRRRDMESAGIQIRNEIPAVIGDSMCCHCVVTPDCRIFKDYEEFFRFHNGFKNSVDKDFIVVDADALEEMRRDINTVELIKDALANDRVEVFYQPIYNTESKHFTSAEALVRIRDVSGQIVSPGVFIPIAERNGLIIPLGEEVFRQVCEKIAAGDMLKMGISYVEVNLSVDQFDQEDLASSLSKIAAGYNVSLDKINLEITETDSVKTKQNLLRNMEILMKSGATFSLDDFGTGNSNLDYFIEMPVEIIKFDFTFTQAYFKTERARTTFESIVEMIHRAGLRIVSEGVETESQLEAMLNLKIDYIQGFYFSKPVPYEEFMGFLKMYNKN